MTLTRNDVPIGSIGGTGNEQRRRRAGQAGSARDRQRLVVHRQRPVRRRHRQRWRQRRQHLDPGQRRQPGHASGPDHDQDQARTALKQLSGEAYPSNASVLLSQGDTVRTLSLDRLRGNLDAPMRAGRPTAQTGGAPSPTPCRKAAPIRSGRRSSATGASSGRRQRGQREPVVRRTLRRRRHRSRQRLARGGAVGYLDSHNDLRQRVAHQGRQLHGDRLRRRNLPPGQLRFAAGATPGTTSTPSAMSRPAR